MQIALQESTPPGCPEGSQPGPHGHQTARTGHQEAARIHWRESTGGQAQGRAGLDAREDLEAQGQESRNGKSGIDRTACGKGGRGQAKQEMTGTNAFRIQSFFFQRDLPITMQYFLISHIVKMQAKSLKEIAQAIGLQTPTHVDWIKAERSLARVLRILIKWAEHFVTEGRERMVTSSEIDLLS